MTRRQWLSRIVRLMLVLLVFAFFAVLFASLDTRILNKATEPEAASVQTLFADIPPGQSQLRRYQNQRVWITRLDQPLREKLRSLNTVLPEPGEGCPIESEICIVSAATTRDGIDIAYSAVPPPILDARLPWVGGFIDPVRGRAYDLLGRAYLKDQSPLEVLR